MEGIKTLTDWTQEELYALPHLEGSWTNEHWEKYHVSSIIILPRKGEDRLHDSGWNTMDFVPCDSTTGPIARTNSFSDVIHLGGIGGFNDKNWMDNEFLRENQVSRLTGWTLDCLPNGLLRLFCHIPIKIGTGLSSFEVFPDWERVDKEREKYLKEKEEYQKQKKNE
jgi:hypothetical protein